MSLTAVRDLWLSVVSVVSFSVTLWLSGMSAVRLTAVRDLPLNGVSVVSLTAVRDLPLNEVSVVSLTVVREPEYPHSMAGKDFAHN